MRVTLKREEPCIYFDIYEAKTFLFGPLSDVSGDIIKKVTVGYVSGSAGPGLRNPERDLTYRVVPRAIQDYDDSYVTTIAENVDTTEKIIEVATHLNSQHNIHPNW